MMLVANVTLMEAPVRGAENGSSLKTVVSQRLSNGA